MNSLLLSQSLLFSRLVHMAILYPATSSLIHLPLCPILLSLPLVFLSVGAPVLTVTCTSLYPAPSLLPTTYRYLAPALRSFKQRLIFFSFLPASLCCFFLFLEVKSVAQAISKLDIARDGLKLLILLLLSRAEISSVHCHIWSRSCSLKSLWNTTRTTWDGLVPVVTFKGTWWLQQSINERQGEECRPHWDYKRSFRGDFEDKGSLAGRKKNLSLLELTD